MTLGIYQIVVTTANSSVLVTVDRTQTVNIVTAGPQGPKGDTGSQGPQGPQGKNPVPYVIALS
jgi:hypothetical protein